MTRAWRFDADAREEVLAAARYYGEQRNELGVEFFDAVEQTLLAVDEAPERARRHPLAPRKLELWVCPMVRFPYVIVFYETSATESRIVAVSHVRRKPLYWLARAKRR